MSLDKLNELKPKLNVEKSIKDILQILKQPHKVYGHGVVSHKEMEKLTSRVESIESQLLDIKDHLGLLSNMDKLNMIDDNNNTKHDDFVGKPMPSEWSVYMLECRDKSIYTGICKGDIDRRMKEPPLTLEQLSEKHGISRERVRQIENKAIDKLKAKILEYS